MGGIVDENEGQLLWVPEARSESFVTHRSTSG